MPYLIAILAISENHAIGKDQSLPWKLSTDMKRFKTLTSGHPMIMGRLTWEALGGPLPNRRHLVVSSGKVTTPGAEVFHTLESAIAACEGAEKVFLIGGSVLLTYAFEKNLVDAMYETLVHAEVEGDTFITPVWEQRFELTAVDARQADEKNEFAYTFRDWVRKTV